MKKIIIRIFILMVIIFNLISTTVVQASLWSDAKDWLSLGENGGTLAPDLTNANTEASNLAGLLFGIGLGIAFIVLAALGVSYLLASSADSKSEIKQKTIVVIVGIVILVGSLFIWRTIVGTLSSGT